MSKILITGGAGFVGTNLIPSLIHDGHEVIVIDNLSHGVYTEVHDFCTKYIVDIRDYYGVEGIFNLHKPEYVFHFAGLVSIYDCNKEPIDAVSNNVIGSTVIFDACVRHGVKKCIFSETSAVYEGCLLPVNGFHERQSNPTTVYSTTKASVALLAESFSRTKNFKYTALRYFNIAGPKQDYSRTVPPLFAGVALRLLGGNNPIVFGDGNRARDFIHVDDINSFHMQCLVDERTDNQTYNLGLGRSTSIYDIISMVAKDLSLRVNGIDQFPEINGEALNIFACIDKARSIGWEPKKTVQDAIRDTNEFLLQEIAAGKINPSKYMTDLKVDEVKIQ